MLAALSIAKLLLSVANTIMKVLLQKQLIDAGMAKATLQGIANANEAIDDAGKAARAVRHDPNSDHAARLREKYTIGKPSEK